MNYATKEDLAEWLGHVNQDGTPDLTQLPEDVDRMLRNASRLIEYSTMNRINIKSESHKDTAMSAVIAQCEYWIEGVGESVDMNPDISSYSAGSASFTFAGGKLPKLAPRARRELWLGGLLNRTVNRA